MEIPVEAAAATALIEVVRITGLPAGRGAAYPGPATAHWTGAETADALALMGTLPGSEQHRCGFSPGWGVRAYGDSLDQALFEAAFCFNCHEIRLQGAAVPPSLTTQFFDADTAPAQALLALFRSTAP
ncbi:hypothetical protein [Streptomyces longispororuber]|uniref:hypothetical protein n=1 Tax=Streptomyces longispororuber TaxID=68230 RepID=UPI00210B7BC8|nr:hypothetical protein [Streptomyces longispororuber]MCQ4210561.1 hypothetical protein [Streptomyces longispororuber]